VAKQLRDIAGYVGVTDSKRIHIVPGNHDIIRGDKTFYTQVYTSYEKKDNFNDISDCKKNTTWLDSLSERFTPFLEVAQELNNPIWNRESIKKPHLFQEYKLFGFNIVYLNTAIADGCDVKKPNLVIGFNHLNEELKKLTNDLPTIAIGHHSLTDLTQEERGKIELLFNQKKIRLYLCGDEHAGDVAVHKNILQLTTGCLLEAPGVESTFYVGTIENQNVSIKAHKYLYKSTRNPGWSPVNPLSAAISDAMKKIPNIIPLESSCESAEETNPIKEIDKYKFDFFETDKLPPYRVLLVKTAIEHPIKDDEDFGVPIGLYVLKDYLKTTGHNFEVDVWDERLELAKKSHLSEEEKKALKQSNQLFTEQLIVLLELFSHM